MATDTRVEAASLRCDLGLLAGTRAWAEQHRWRLARQVALARDAFTCVDCGVTDWDAALEVHHLVPLAGVAEYDAPSCAHHPDGLLVLCVTCHQYRHLCLRSRPGTQLGFPAALLDRA